MNETQMTKVYACSQDGRVVRFEVSQTGSLLRLTDEQRAELGLPTIVSVYPTPEQAKAEWTRWVTRNHSAVFADLVAKTLIRAEVGTAGYDDAEALILTTDDGWVYSLYHERDCCESVYIEEIHGNLSDLVGSPILMADESYSGTPPDPGERDYTSESETWSFYTFRTVKGTVVVRFYGSSNGYYGETAALYRRLGEDNTADGLS